MQVESGAIKVGLVGVEERLAAVEQGHSLMGSRSG